MDSIKVGYYKRRDGKRNFGDDLSPILISELLKMSTQHSSIFNAEILGIGSILSYWRRPRTAVLRNLFCRVMKRKPLAIWGTGLISANFLSLPEHQKIAVRGPLTAKYLGSDGNIPFGDPGILAPYLVKSEKKSGLIGVIPHYVDKNSEIITSLPLNAGLKIIDVESNCLEVLSDISSCDYVLSSSLHGLICADAYGIPNARISLSNKIGGGDFKFNDYCYGVSREPLINYQVKNYKDIFSTISNLKKYQTMADEQIIEKKSEILRNKLLEWFQQRLEHN